MRRIQAYPALMLFGGNNENEAAISRTLFIPVSFPIRVSSDVINLLLTLCAA